MLIEGIRLPMDIRIWQKPVPYRLLIEDSAEVTADSVSTVPSPPAPTPSSGDEAEGMWKGG